MTGAAVGGVVGAADGPALPDGPGAALPDGAGAALPDGTGDPAGGAVDAGVGDGVASGVGDGVAGGWLRLEGAGVGGTKLGAGVGLNWSAHAYVGREAFRKNAVARRRKPSSAAIQVNRLRCRSRKGAVPAAGRRDRRVARLAELGRRGGVVKVGLVG